MSLLLGILQPPAGFGTPDGGVRPAVVWVEREAHVMGTVLLLRVAGADTAAAWRGTEAALRAVERTDGLLSTWRDDSELAALNRAPPGDTVHLSRALAAMLHEVGALELETGGAFDPAVGALVDAWRLRGTGAVPDSARLESARAATGWRRFSLGPGWAIRWDGDAWIDSGGFGKGAALRAAGEALTAEGTPSAFLNFGGQVYVVGMAPVAWPIAVADPGDRTRAATTLRVTGGSVATTSQSEQTLVVGDQDVGHVLDPRSGRPVAGWGGVTVVERDPLRADALATALFVLGPEEGWAWAEARRVAAVFVEVGEGTVSTRATTALMRNGWSHSGKESGG